MKTFLKFLFVAFLISPRLPAASSLMLGQFEGKRTGTVFQKEGRAFILSSDGTSQLAPSISFEDGKTYKTEVLLDDWAFGLSLLEVKMGEGIENLPTLEELLSGNAQKGEGELKGYLQSESKFHTSSVEVLQVLGKRHTLPWIKNTLEVKGVGKDLSLQGAALISQNGFQGLVSRQYLKLIPGSSTRVFDWKDKDLSSQTIYYLVIPNHEIKEWVTSVLSSQKTASSFTPKGSSSGDLQFSMQCPPEPEGPTSQPKPIGGADGVGIGGEGSWVPPCELEITSASKNASAWSYPHQQHWYDWAKEQTAKGKKLKVLFFAYHEKGTHRLSRVPIYTLSEVALLLRNENYRPIGVEVGAEVTDPSLKLLREESSKLIRVAEGVYSKYSDKSIGKFLSGLHMLGHILNSEEWKFVTTEDIRRFENQNGEYHAAWSNLSFAFQKEKTELLSLLTKLGELRKSLPE